MSEPDPDVECVVIMQEDGPACGIPFRYHGSIASHPFMSEAQLDALVAEAEADRARAMLIMMCDACIEAGEPILVNREPKDPAMLKRLLETGSIREAIGIDDQT